MNPRLENETDPCTDLGYPTIDLQLALDRLFGDLQLLTKIIGDFILRYESFTENFLNLIQRKRFNDAVRMVHSLKGVCANLGFMDLEIASEKLETSLKYNEQESMESSLQEVRRVLREKICSLKDWLESRENPHKEEPQKVSPEIKRTLAILEASLQKNSDLSLHLYKQVVFESFPPELHPAWKRLGDYLQAGDFLSARWVFESIFNSLQVVEKVPGGMARS